jgi:hypothetical protein
MLQRFLNILCDREVSFIDIGWLMDKGSHLGDCPL